MVEQKKDGDGDGGDDYYVILQYEERHLERHLQVWSRVPS
jgi:hypothetical protein